MRRAAGWSACAMIAFAGGCERPRTELVVRVEAELEWGPGRRVQSIVLSVRRGGAGGPLRSTRATALGATAGERWSLPLYVGIVAADGDLDTPVWIEALGCGAPDGCTVTEAVVAHRAVLRFARGETQEVPLLLAAATR